jgi:hypothetical protein
MTAAAATTTSRRRFRVNGTLGQLERAQRHIDPVGGMPCATKLRRSYGRK